MTVRTRSIVATVATGIGAGLVWYASQFLGPGSSPAALQLTQLLRQLVSTAVLVGAAVVGYAVYEPASVRRSPGAVLGTFLLAGVVAVVTLVGALTVAPPPRFSVGSYALTSVTVLLAEAIPFALAGFAGAAFGAVRPR